MRSQRVRKLGCGGAVVINTATPSPTPNSQASHGWAGPYSLLPAQLDQGWAAPLCPAWSDQGWAAYCPPLRTEMRARPCLAKALLLERRSSDLKTWRNWESTISLWKRPFLLKRCEFIFYLNLLGLTSSIWFLLYFFSLTSPLAHGIFSRESTYIPQAKHLNHLYILW